MVWMCRPVAAFAHEVRRHMQGIGLREGIEKVGSIERGPRAHSDVARPTLCGQHIGAAGVVDARSPQRGDLEQFLPRARESSPTLGVDGMAEEVPSHEIPRSDLGSGAGFGESGKNEGRRPIRPE